MRRLLIRPGGIGDCITCFPAMESLRADYTEVWVPSPVVPLVQFAHRVRSIASTGLDLLGIGYEDIPESLVESLGEFDEIVSWYGFGRPEFQGDARQFNHNWRFFPALPPADYQGHATDFHAALVGAALHLRPYIQAAPVQLRSTVVIHPFSGGRCKNWPLACFQDLARQLSLPVEWTAGPEEELGAAVRFDNLLDLARWLQGASLYIGNDSGISHLAAAVGVPTLALFVATAPAVWAPRGRNVMVLEQPFTVSEVLQAAESLLQHRR